MISRVVVLFALTIFLVQSCYKKSDDVCPSEEQPRSLKVTYQAHWDATVNVSSNYNDTLFIYRMEPEFELIETLDSGQSTSYSFPQFEKYNLWVDAVDSVLQDSVNPFVSASVIYSCPEG